MLNPKLNTPEPPPKPAALSFKVFAKTNWAGSERYRVEITYANGLTRALAPEFRDEDGAFRYMGRFHSSIPQQT
jgi:hypothetical protein